VKDKYNFSSRYADEYVKGFINHEDLKIDNDKLMFKSLSVYGFEGSSEYEYFAHTIKGDKLQIFALASYNMMGEIDTEDPEEMVFNFVKEEGEYRFDGYNYMGHEYIIK
jgi:hypothetical protein